MFLMQAGCKGGSSRFLFLLYVVRQWDVLRLSVILPSPNWLLYSLTLQFRVSRQYVSRFLAKYVLRNHCIRLMLHFKWVLTLPKVAFPQIPPLTVQPVGLLITGLLLMYHFLKQAIAGCLIALPSRSSAVNDIHNRLLYLPTTNHSASKLGYCHPHYLPKNSRFSTLGSQIWWFNIQ